jgi:hypothetical protein
MKLFEQINVWERKSSDEAICYRCFRLLADNTYSVQSADFYRPYDQDAIDHERKAIELLLDMTPDERAGSFATLEAAILDFKKNFA